MAFDRDNQIQTVPLKPLTRDDLDQRIQHVASEVASDAVVNRAVEAASDETLKPRWIRPADLVRRMRPYIVYN
jgi:hypothetical protein